MSVAFILEFLLKSNGKRYLIKKVTVGPNSQPIILAKHLGLVENDHEADWIRN